MRISTLARTKSAIILFVMLALASQYAFAQLPIETRQLRLQGSASGAVVLQSAPTVTTPYILTYPDAIGTGQGSFLFMGTSGSSTGQLKWSSQATVTGHIPVWNQTDATINWVGADSDLFPVWGLNGNQLADATKRLGSRNLEPFDIVTDNVARVTFAANGDISINTANSGANTTIGRATGHTTTVNGTTAILGTTDINVTGSSGTTIGNASSTLTSNAGTLDINAATATIDASTSLGITGLTNVNIIGTAATTIGNATSTLTSDAGTLDINAATATIDATTALTVVAPTSINVTGLAATTIGNSTSALTSNAGTLTVNATTASVTAATSLTVVAPTSINVTGSSGTTIGNENSTTAITGPTNINITGSALTRIGNSGASGSDTRFSGEIQMEEDPGDAGDVLISSGANNTPSWKNLNDAIGIRAAGNVTVSPAGVATATISAPGLTATDAILVTLQTTGTPESTVVATVTSRDDTADTFTVTFSAQYNGVVNYLVIKTL